MSLLTNIRALIRRYDMNERMLTPAQVWGRGGMWVPLSGSGISVTAEMAMQAAVGACVRLLADDISSLPVDVIRKVDGVSVPSNRPLWLEYPTGLRWDTFQAHLSDVVVSLLTDGNAFVECFPDSFSPSYFRVHDPESIQVKNEAGTVTYSKGSTIWSEANMMHIPWVRMPGKARGLSVLQAAKESAGLELAAREWAGAFFRNGGTLGTVIEHPGKPSPEELDTLRESFSKRHEGSSQAWKLGVVTGGAKLVDGTIKPQEAALEPLWKHVLEEAARLFHIPPHLLGSQDPGGASFASVEQRDIGYVVHAVVPITTRLESAYSRFLGRQRFIKLNTNALLRGDTKARAEYYQIMTGIKAMKPENVAGLEDFPPGWAAQGWLETPNNNGPKEGEEPPADEAASIIVSDVTLRDGAEEQITERVAAAAQAGVEQTAADVAQAVIDIHARADRMEASVAEMIARDEQRRAEEEEARRIAAMAPGERLVKRDERGRITGVINRKGDVVTRSVIERDAGGAVIRIVEVAA